MSVKQKDSIEQVNLKTRDAYNLAAQKYYDLFHNEMNEKEYDRKLLDEFAKRFNTTSVICDAGCGPSGHIGRYIYDKGIHVVGIDISEKCVELARKYNPDMKFERVDIGNMPFENECFDGIISYYSIIDTPKNHIKNIFNEFFRVLKPDGYLLVAVKVGDFEGYLEDLIGIKTEIYFTLFNEDEIRNYFEESGFKIDFIEIRNPYDFEINNERIFAIGKKY